MMTTLSLTLAFLLGSAPHDWLRSVLPKGVSDPWIDYVIFPLIQIVVVFVVVITFVAYFTLAERKVSAWIQVRMGPMRVGPYGLLQPLADGIKLLIKEDIIPARADRVVFTIAPIIAMATALMMLVVLPYGAGWGTITDINIGLLFILAISSVGTLGIILGGWASNSKYPLLGALRSSAQMISYEVAMGLSIIGAVMFTKTLSMAGSVESQIADGIWYVFYQPLGFFIYVVSAVAETNRAPFDLPEAESELTGGFHTEYSGFRFSLYFIAEYAAMFVVSAVAVTLYLGGWSLPYLSLLQPNHPVLFVLLSIAVFFAKVLLFIWVYMWIRWTLPRYRYDQLMDIGWKWMIPAALANIVLTGALFVIGQELRFVTTSGDHVLVGGLQGKLFMIGTALGVTVPACMMLLSVINRNARGLNLEARRQLQMSRRAERLASQQGG